MYIYLIKGYKETHAKLMGGFEQVGTYIFYLVTGLS